MNYAQRTFGNQHDWAMNKMQVLITNPEGTLTLVAFDSLPNRLALIVSLIPSTNAPVTTTSVHRVASLVLKEHGECPPEENFWAWYVSVRKVRVSSMHRDFTVMFRYLQMNGYYSRTYKAMFLNFRLKQRDGVRKGDLILTEDEIACLIRKEYDLSNAMNRAKQKALDLFVLSLYTGARYTDIRSIVKSTDEKGNPVLLLHNRKGTESKMIAWNPAVEGALRRNLYVTRGKDQVLGAALRVALFETLPTTSNRVISYYYIQPGRGRVLKSDGRLAHITFHAARHTFCTRLLRIGVSPAIVAKLAGHKSIQTTMKYYNWTRESEANDILRDVYNQKGVVTTAPEWGEGANVKPLSKALHAAQMPIPQAGLIMPDDGGLIAKHQKVHPKRKSKLPPRKQAIVDAARRMGAI